MRSRRRCRPGRVRPWRCSDRSPATTPALADFVATVPGGELVEVDAVPVVTPAEQLGRPRTTSAESMRRTLRKAANRTQTDGVDVVVAVHHRLRRDPGPAAGSSSGCTATATTRRGGQSELDDPTRVWLWRSRLIGLARQRRLEVATSADRRGRSRRTSSASRRATDYRVLEGVLATRFSRYSPGSCPGDCGVAARAGRPGLRRLDWMTSVASETLLTTNDVCAVSVVRAAFHGADRRRKFTLMQRPGAQWNGERN